MASLFEDGVGPPEWDDDPEDWEEEEYYEDEEFYEDDSEGDEIVHHDGPPLPISRNGHALKIGDKITLEGDINRSAEIVYIASEMKQIINSGRVFDITDIKQDGTNFYIHAAGWSWSCKNVKKLDETPPPPQPFLFDEKHLDL